VNRIGIGERFLPFKGRIKVGMGHYLSLSKPIPIPTSLRRARGACAQRQTAVLSEIPLRPLKGKELSGYALRKNKKEIALQVWGVLREVSWVRFFNLLPWCAS
jgi:hypothetical protein